MPKPTYNLNSKVTVYPGMGGWRFLTVPKKTSAEIREAFGELAAGWGSIRVIVTIGKTEWKTSIFPDKKTDTYLLPLKSPVRKAEKISDDAKVKFTIQIDI